MAVSRNDPCPCGSGKKYKRCCLLADEQAGQPPGQEWHRLDERLGGVIGHWAKRRFGETWTESLDVYPIAFGKDLAHYPLFFAWAVYERKIEGRPVASWYLEAQGRNLMAHERDWLAAQLRAWLSVWEVLDVEPGKDAIIDNSHVVCWDSTLKYEISITTGQSGGFLGNLVNSQTSGEGVVLRFSGRGKVYVCSRNRAAFKSWTQKAGS